MRSCDIYIAITTFDRPKEFDELMSDIRRETEAKNVHVHVYNDGSPAGYSATVGDLTAYARNHGKKGYWQVMGDIFRDAETWSFKYFFLLQDDCRLAEGFFEKAIAEFEGIPDRNKGTLCTFTPESVYERTMWGNKKAEDVKGPNGMFLRGNYVDCIFMCPRETLQALAFRIDPVPTARFLNNDVISSGVGQQLTQRLMRLRKGMWVAYSSLIVGHSNESRMNKKERAKNPLNPLVREREIPFVLSELVSFKKEKVVAGMASIKDREESLEKAVSSILDQVDHLFVYLNDYEKVPSFLLNEEKITYYLGKIWKDRGDTGKFFALQQQGIEDGYFFSCDDDLVYPPDYVEKTVRFIKDYGNRVIATYHGAILRKGILENYYRDRKQVHYASFQRISIEVNIGGTGVMGFHVPTFKPDISKFLYPNMSDIWVGIQAQEEKIPIVCAPRFMRWIKAEEIPIEKTIYGSKENHDIQTEVINAWKREHGEFQEFV